MRFLTALLESPQHILAKASIAFNPVERLQNSYYKLALSLTKITTVFEKSLLWIPMPMKFVNWGHKISGRYVGWRPRPSHNQKLGVASSSISSHDVFNDFASKRHRSFSCWCPNKNPCRFDNSLRNESNAWGTNGIYIYIGFCSRKLKIFYQDTFRNLFCRRSSNSSLLRQ